jgi:hypothetical protein
MARMAIDARGADRAIDRQRRGAAGNARIEPPSRPAGRISRTEIGAMTVAGSAPAVVVVALDGRS